MTGALVRLLTVSQATLMRELVYLSQLKLLQFREESHRGAGVWRRFKSVGIKAPLSLGELSVTLDDSQGNPAPNLERVLAHIQESAKWYEAEDLRVGDWVQFEATMNWSVVKSIAANGAWGLEKWDLEAPYVMFWQAAPLNQNALILHGSPSHLFEGNYPSGDPMMVAGSGLRIIFECCPTWIRWAQEIRPRCNSYGSQGRCRVRHRQLLRRLSLDTPE
jgi:hypothetical protein